MRTDWQDQLDALRRVVAEAVRRVRRTQPGPALLRLIAGLAAVAAFVVATPIGVAHSNQAFAFTPLAIGVALFPRTRIVTLTAIVAVLLWMIGTIGVASPSPVQLGLLAAALYVMHSAAAVAAVLPYDAAVSRSVLLRWAGRVSAVTVTSVAVGLSMMAVVSQLPAQRSQVGPIIGAILAAVLVAILAVQRRISR
jgi:hypothetical protein